MMVLKPLFLRRFSYFMSYRAKASYSRRAGEGGAGASFSGAGKALRRFIFTLCRFPFLGNMTKFFASNISCCLHQNSEIYHKSHYILAKIRQNETNYKFFIKNKLYINRLKNVLHFSENCL
jgi:hypothetical protein